MIKNTEYKDTKEYTTIPFKDIQILDSEPVVVSNPYSGVSAVVEHMTRSLWDSYGDNIDDIISEEIGTDRR